MFLPPEIKSLIHEYRSEFERVDREIEEAVSLYSFLEERANTLLTDLREGGLCEYHISRVETALNNTTEQGAMILNDILTHEKVTIAQRELLNSLTNEVIYTVFNTLVDPFIQFNYLQAL